MYFVLARALDERRKREEEARKRQWRRAHGVDGFTSGATGPEAERAAAEAALAKAN